MAIHNEIEFENDICDHLSASGWLYAEKDAAAVIGKTYVREYSAQETT